MLRIVAGALCACGALSAAGAGRVTGLVFPEEVHGDGMCPVRESSASSITTAGRRLEGKTVVVTGGASGIGKAICLQCVAEGAFVVAFDIRSTPLEGGTALEDAAGKLTAGNGQLIMWHGDVTCSRDIDACIKEVTTRKGCLDVWVNNAAIGLGGRLTETSEEDFDRVLAVNAKGYFLGAKRAVQEMLKQPVRNEVRGKIINITSQHGMVACPGDLAYGVGKAAVVYMTRQIAHNYAKDHILCNAVAPGKIVTGFDDDDRPYSLARTPAPRLGKPEDVAQVVVWLASDEAPSYIRGENIMVDGGWMAS